MHVRAFSKDNIFCEYSPDYSTFTIVLIVMYFESKTESKYCYSNYLFSQCMETCRKKEKKSIRIKFCFASVSYFIIIFSIGKDSIEATRIFSNTKLLDFKEK